MSISLLSLRPELQPQTDEHRVDGSIERPPARSHGKGVVIDRVRVRRDRSRHRRSRRRTAEAVEGRVHSVEGGKAAIDCVGGQRRDEFTPTFGHSAAALPVTRGLGGGEGALKDPTGESQSEEEGTIARLLEYRG
ncbi:hypothetical protein K0M31_019598 [Melipona bicolor]|uniref:Uncharacterized protein n=1 Tax=Melipona bicolor TaxID=60889 RepID=A0AA40KRJ2_9HYME|nr:hypothetical protein K0M31_019598 [Melipona bicolor]